MHQKDTYPTIFKPTYKICRNSNNHNSDKCECNFKIT